MKLTIKILNEYRRMSDAQRLSERGTAIRAELNYRMRWMPRKWRNLVRARYIKRMSCVRAAMEIHVSERTFNTWVREIAEWLEDTDRYLEELT